MGRVFQRFSEISELQLSYPAELAAGVRSPGVSGRHTPEEALERLLEASVLDYRTTPNKTVTIKLEG